MAAKKPAETGSALATQSGGAALANAGPVLDELAGLGDDFVIEDDGLGEIDRSDFKIAAYVLNMKGVDENGRKLPEDEYYNTVDEVTKREVNAVLLHLHKSNLWSYYDEQKGETVRVCSSFDRVTGTMLATGEKRPCEDCPDAKWNTSPEGKRSRSCGDVYNIFGIDRDTMLPFVYRFKKTAIPVVKQYLQKHFIGRRMIRDKVTGATKRVNYPLFAFETRMSVRMSDDKKYSLPVLNRGDLLVTEELIQRQTDQGFIRDNVVDLFEAGEKQDKAADAAPDTSFDPNKFAGGAGEDFVDTEGTSTPSSNAA